jgi:membrane protein implicated in regulation of membrane protease activity
MEHAMSWLDLYVGALVVGFALSALSLVLGAHHLHLPRGFTFGGHAHMGPMSGHAHAGIGQRGGAGSEVPVANFSSLMMFLAWFGGAGAVLRLLGFGPAVSLIGATASGVFGAWLLVLFLRRVLLVKDHAMRPDDYALPGVVATVSLAIREGGTGEISYVQGGTRKSAAARTEAGEAIGLGAEVVVLRFENGIAHVRAWHVTKGSYIDMNQRS